MGRVGGQSRPGLTASINGATSGNMRFDLLIIGAGSAGLTAASFAARLGVRVGLVEAERIGGDCTWYGCVPSKTLIECASTHARGKVRPRLADLAPIHAHVQEVARAVGEHESPEQLARLGVEVLLGRAEMEGPNSVRVGQSVRSARRVILATGARPTEPPIPGLAETPHWTYRDVFEVKRPPERLIVLGAGPIGVELGQAFARLGSQVTIIDSSDRVLSVADPSASEVLAQALRDDGVTLILNESAARVWSSGAEIAVRVGEQTITGDGLLVATGRRPNLDGLGLEHAGITVRDDRLVIDRNLRTSAPHVYAAGDVTAAPQFTHVAGWQGFVAARNALLPGAMPGLGPAVPWVIFTDPEVAQIGPTEAACRVRYPDTRVYAWPLERVDRAHTRGDARGFIKLICRANRRLVGATLVGSGVGEMINELAVAIQRKSSLDDLAGTIHAYPTLSFGLQQLSAEVTLVALTEGWKGAILRMLARH